MSSDLISANQLSLITESMLNECLVALVIPSELLNIESAQKLGNVNQALRNSQKFNEMLAKYDKKTGKIIS